MRYVGIDLGTTNSAICSYDGELVTLYKSPSQSDVTPSAIFFDKRKNKHVGIHAYNQLALDPESVASGFKRLMGTSTPIKLTTSERALTPQECSSEILKALYSYLPDEIRNDVETGTVITVPAAFDQMQKDATMSAAQLAGLGRVALMQEPVAAVMSVMRHRKGDSIFVVYDLGGGTLDIAIAESLGGHVSLMSHGGAAMKGGRDFDRLIVEEIVKPWLSKTFKLQPDFFASPKAARIMRTALWAAENAKIELSQKEKSVISAPEGNIAAKDQDETEIYLDIEITRSQLNDLIQPLIEESVKAVEETLAKAGLTAADIDRIVFVGGPTQYKPLRDKVSQQLSIAASTDVNPMTAVAEGAAIFAESIDWSTASHGRKSSRGTINAGTDLSVGFQYIARTPDIRAKIVAQVSGSTVNGAEFQIDSLDTGWSSGKIALKNGAAIELSLTKPGENTFKIYVFDASGGPIELPTNRIVITRTAATIDAIPASSSIGIEALDKLGGRPILEYLVKEGEPLPKKGIHKFKAGESLRSGSASALNFKIREGEISDPITDNRCIGLFSVNGTDFEDGVIPAGADLFCEYEILDSGNINIKVSAPSVGGAFSARNYYSRQAGEIDYTQASKQISSEAERLRKRLDLVTKKVSDPLLETAAQKLDQATTAVAQETDPEAAKLAMDGVQEAKKILAEVRQKNLREIRNADLENCIAFFENYRELARPTETSAFEAIARTAQRAIDKPAPEFESLLREMWGKIQGILIRQDWYIVDRFKHLSDGSYVFLDKTQHTELVSLGKMAIQNDDVEKLRQVVAMLESLRFQSSSEEDMLATTNIVKA